MQKIYRSNYNKKGFHPMFKFRLRRVLEVKKYREDILKQRLAALQYAHYYQEAILAHLRKEKENYLEQLTDMVEGGKEIIIERLNLYLSFLQELNERIVEEEKILEKIKEDLEKTRKLLIEIQKERRLLEILQEKQYKAYLQKEEYIYQNILDEIGLNIYTKNKEG
jgi:flagellar FliJ protein